MSAKCRKWSRCDRLFVEEISMGTGPDEMEFVPRYPIDQEPVRFYVSVAIALPVPFQRMILVARRRLFAGDQ
jgi:hypothetical protein